MGDKVNSGLVIDVVCGVLALAVVVSVVRTWAIKKTLAQRVSWGVFAADEFDPAKEDVLRFALQLGRARKVLEARLLRPSAAVRFRLSSVPEGRVLYEVSAPRSGRAVIRAAMFDRVELRDLESLDVEALGLQPDNGVGPLAAGDPQSAPEPDEERVAPSWPDEEVW